jgi:hypothetical protein
MHRLIQYPYYPACQAQSVNFGIKRLMADFGESGMAEIDGKGRRDDTLLSRRTRQTIL